jgi:hypothetical protein
MTALAIFQHIIVWLPLVVGGVFLIRAGLRGRRVNDHPICRRCRFDLIGLGAASAAETPDTALESSATKERAIGSESRSTRSRPDRCPECGTPLTGTTRRARRAVIDGERRRRWWAFSFGVVLLLAGLGTGFWLTYKPLAKFPWTTWAPDWVLAEMVDTQNTRRAILVRQEILQRVRRDTLSRTAAAMLTREILAMQASRSRKWNVADGSLLESLRRASLVSDEHWKTYAKQSLCLLVTARSCVAEHQPITWELRYELRLGILGRPYALSVNAHRNDAPIFVDIDQIGTTAGGVDVAADVAAPSVVLSAASRKWSRLFSGEIQHDQLESGRHSGSVNVRVTAIEGPLASTSSLRAHPVIVSWVERVPFEFTKLSPGESCVTLRAEEHLRDKMQFAFAGGFLVEPNEFGDPCLVSHNNGTLPSAVAFEIEGHIHHPNGRSEPVWFLPIRAEKDASSPKIQSFPIDPLLPGSRLTVRLKPSADIARQFLDMTEIWGEEIILENVPIVIEGE